MREAINLAKNLELVERLKTEDGYLDVKVLPDGSVACLIRLMYTTAIALGVNDIGWETRFCFEDRELALKRWSELQSQDDEPQGYIARRG